MKKIFFAASAFVILAGVSSMAVESGKPADHNTAWVQLHGKAAKADESGCLSCHTERLECIACHEDMAPRSHNSAWAQKNHGLESRWNRNSCKTCHREDFCTECHETALPLSHSRAGFGTAGAPGFHCNTSCQLPYGSWRNTPAKNCLVCHGTRPILSTGAPHTMN